MQNESSELPFCPSFNSYSTDNKLGDIADRVSRDFKNDGVSGDEEFEFVSYSTDLRESDDAPSLFPIFNRDLTLNCREGGDDVEKEIPIRLRNLFIGDGDLPSSSSSSSSEVDELEGVPTETYCVWKPKKSAESSPANRCKKSKSTGSSPSKRWRFIKDLLKRSNSDGNVSSSSILVMNFDKNNTADQKKNIGEKLISERTSTAKKMKRVDQKASAHEVFYVKNKALKEGDKRRSYLPYRQDLVGIFSNVNGLGRTFPPF